MLPEQLKLDFRNSKTIKHDGVRLTLAPLENTDALLRKFDEVILSDEQQSKGHPLTSEQIWNVGPAAFDIKLVQDGMHKLTGDGKIDEAKFFQFQAGQKALIFCVEAIRNRKSHWLVYYLSRGDSSSRLGIETHHDYQNLTMMYRRYTDFLTDAGKRQYSVIRPLAFKQTKIGNKYYPAHLTPFAREYGELNVKAYGLGPAMITPHFRYAHSPTIGMIKQMQSIEKTGPLQIVQEIAALAGSMGIQHGIKMNGDGTVTHNLAVDVLDLLKDKIQDSVAVQRSGRFILDVLVGEALMYLLSGQHVALEHYINSGDSMVKYIPVHSGVTARLRTDEGIVPITLFKKADLGLELKAMTVRGGFSPNTLTFPEWIRHMRNHTETHAPSTNRININDNTQLAYLFRPFEGLQDPFFYFALSREQSLIKR